jgi:hypothetical protein
MYDKLTKLPNFNNICHLINNIILLKYRVAMLKNICPIADARAALA